MGMKNKIALASMMLGVMAQQEDAYQLENPRNRKPNEPKKADEPKPFNKEGGVLKTIQDYKDIKSGISKKGQLKQNRILERVEKWLSKGMLTKEDVL